MEITFSSHEILPGIIHILMPGKTPGPGRVHTTLILGEEQALLLDTGYGIGDLRSYVETLTSLPVTVANTHGHIDHCGGNSQWDAVWLNPADYALADWSCTREAREASADLADYLEVLNYGDYEKKPLTEGVSFDLGGRIVTAYACPGHTLGSMAFLDDKTKTLFTGDNITRRVLLITSKEATLANYLKMLNRIGELDFAQIVAAHVPYVMPRSWLDKVKSVVLSFDAAKGKPPICFSIKMTGMEPLEFTVGRDFDDPEYCGFVFDNLHLDKFLEGWPVQ